jgi:hypothetical protein
VTDRPPWEREHHPWTEEGRIEDYGRLLRGLRGPRLRNPFTGFMLKIVFVTFALVIGIAILVEIAKAVLK